MTTRMRLATKLKSADLLDDYMVDREETNRSLAPKVGVSPATISHLRRGARTYCRLDVAKAIEKKLNAPPGSLFLREVIGGSQAVGRSA